MTKYLTLTALLLSLHPAQASEPQDDSLWDTCKGATPDIDTREIFVSNPDIGEFDWKDYVSASYFVSPPHKVNSQQNLKSVSEILAELGIKTSIENSHGEKPNTEMPAPSVDHK